ncbi:hypothetical protein ACFOHM_26615 [Microbaculum marinum]
MEVLHARFVEFIKNIETYHHGYRAAFDYDRDARFAAVEAPTLVTCARPDFAYRHLEVIAAMFPTPHLPKLQGRQLRSLQTRARQS